MNVFKRNSAKSLLMLVTAGAALTLSSCRDDDKAPNIHGGNNFKITVTIPNVEATTNSALDDYVSITTAGSTANPQESGVWKLNGAVQAGQLVVGLSEDDFAGATKTYVIESTKPLLSVSAGFQIINSNSPITVSYKIEKNGDVVVNENFTLADGENRHKQFNL